jgi:ketosteroid isomerase-like protein
MAEHANAALVRRFYETLFAGGDYRATLAPFSDDHAAALLWATGSRQGKQYRALEMDVFHIKDGRTSEFWSFSEDQRRTDEY